MVKVKMAALKSTLRVCRTEVYFFRCSSLQCMQALYVFHQPVRFKSTEFGGFTRDKYLAKRFKKAREYVRSRLKSPLRTETQGFRAMKWPMAIASLSELNVLCNVYLGVLDYIVFASLYRQTSL